jgi:hypothetical protein
MREDSGGNGHDDGQGDDDSPKTKYICRIEALTLNHLKQPD